MRLQPWPLLWANHAKQPKYQVLPSFSGAPISMQETQQFIPMVMDPPAGIWLKSCSMLMFLVWQPHWFSCGPNMFWRSTMSNATLEAPLVWFQWTTCCFQFHTTKAMMKPQPLCCSPTQSIVKLEKKVAAADKVHQRLFGLPCVPWCNTNFKLFGFPCLSLYNYQQLKTMFFLQQKTYYSVVTCWRTNGFLNGFHVSCQIISQ